MEDFKKEARDFVCRIYRLETEMDNIAIRIINEKLGENPGEGIAAGDDCEKGDGITENDGVLGDLSAEMRVENPGDDGDWVEMGENRRLDGEGTTVGEYCGKVAEITENDGVLADQSAEMGVENPGGVGDWAEMTEENSSCDGDGIDFDCTSIFKRDDVWIKLKEEKEYLTFFLKYISEKQRLGFYCDDENDIILLDELRAIIGYPGQAYFSNVDLVVKANEMSVPYLVIPAPAPAPTTIADLIPTNMSSGKVSVMGGWSDPYTIRVLLALKFKGIDYNYIEHNLGMLQSSPKKSLPLLVHGDSPPICDSLVIIQYIDECWGNHPKILPSDPYERANARFWASSIDNQLWPALNGLKMLKGQANRAEVQKVVEVLTLLEDVFVTCSRGDRFFGGKTIGYLDIAVGSFLGWVWATEKIINEKLFDQVQIPELFLWAKAFSLDDTVKSVVPESEQLVNLTSIVSSLV